MSNLSFELQDQLTPVLRLGDLATCDRIVASRLSSLPPSPFHVVLEISITNETREAAQYFDEFFRQQPREKVRAAYTELNGFSIKPGHWFCTPFAYQQYGGHDDYDWLSNWQSGDFDAMPITGLETLQKVYAGDAVRGKHFSDARDLASLLVVIKFQDLIRRAATLMKELRFPLLATAHDYDFIYEVQPGA